MQRLAIGHHDIVGNVHNIVDGPQANDAQFVLHPFGTLLDLTVLYTDGRIASATFGSHDIDLNLIVMVVHFEGIDTLAMETRLIAVFHEPSVQVACHSVV